MCFIYKLVGIVYFYKKNHVSPPLPKDCNIGANLISEKELCQLYVIHHQYMKQIIIVRNNFMIIDPEIQIGQG